MQKTGASRGSRSTGSRSAGPGRAPRDFSRGGGRDNRRFDRNRGRRDKGENRLNDEITASQIRLVGDNIPEQGVYPTSQALALAEELGLDLVEISANAEPPVCKILDYQKFLYQKKKREKEMKQKSSKIVIKEIRFGPNTDDHDFNFKLKHARGFLEDGNKVKASIFFRGRSIVFADQGKKQLLRFAVELEEVGRAENMPVLEGKRMTMMIAPIKKNK